jgi:hypothetical protein
MPFVGFISGTVYVGQQMLIKSMLLWGIQWSLMLAATIYIFITTVFLHGSYVETPPRMFINLWDISNRQTETPEQANSHFFCHNLSYNWNVTASQIAGLGFYNNTNPDGAGCTWLDSELLVQYTTSEAAVITFLWEKPPNQTWFTGYFTTQVEPVRLMIQHGAWMPDGKPWVNPRTAVTGTDIVFPDSTPINFTIAQLLTWLGTDLEDLNPQIIPGWPAIRYRMTGMQIAVSMDYNNVFDWSLQNRLECSMTFSLIPGIWGTMSDTQMGDIAVRRKGIRMDFQSSGNISSFSFVELVKQLTQWTVLLGLAKRFIRFLLYGKVRASVWSAQIPFPATARGIHRTWRHRVWFRGERIKTTLDTSSSDEDKKLLKSLKMKDTPAEGALLSTCDRETSINNSTERAW